MSKISQQKTEYNNWYNTWYRLCNSKRILKGTVVSAKNNKTIVVKVIRKFQHPFYGKVISRSKKYHAHDENNLFKVGDIVKIIESKPISKLKSWTVVNDNQEKI